MDPSALYTLTLSQLQTTELRLTSPDGTALINTAPAAERQAALQVLLDVHQTRLALANAALQSIADALEAKEPALLAGTAALSAATAALNDLARIVQTAADVLDLVGTIVSMV